MILVYVVLALLAVLVYRSYAKHKRVRDMINKIPGPPTLPIIGNLMMFNVSTEKLWDVLRSLNREYYPITRFWLGPIPTISIHHPDDLEILLSSQKHLDKGFAYKCLFPWLKTGLLTATGSKWHQRRKILTPAFHFKILQKYLEITNENGKRFIDEIRNQGEESVQCLIPFCSKYTLHIICESAMGVALDRIDSKNAKEYKSAISSMSFVIVYRALRPYIQDWMLTPLLKIGQMQRKALKTLHGFTNKVLLERKEYHERSGYKYLENDEVTPQEEKTFDVLGRKKKLVMLDLLLSAEKDGLIDEDGIREELSTFMFAGHDTTGIALVYTIMLLAENKEIQDKARAEVVRVLEQNKGDIGQAELQEFHYLERCIKESLRLFPPASALSRVPQEDLKLRDYTIPAGTEIGVHIFDLHRDPNFWPEPTKYNPDRFLPESIQGRHPYSYLPFSAGPRNCIGQKFALMELKCLTARILYNFELEPISRTSDMKLFIDMVTRPLDPVYAKFIKIDNNN